MRRTLSLALLLPLALLAAYLLLWPVPVAPAAWSAPPAPGYSGPHDSNTRLAAMRHIELAGESGPEHIVVRDGWLYTAVLSGAIVRMRPDGSERQVVVKTGGRPLGFDFDPRGNLVIADPMAGEHGGLWRMSNSGNPPKLELLTDRVDGDPIRYANSVVVARTRKMYFTDASRRFGAKAWGGTFQASVLDVLEHQSTGRLLEYDPATRRTRLLMSDLSFANGLALSADEQHLFLSETAEYRIWKVSVAARAISTRTPSKSAKVLLANLPGFPDNLMRGQNGRIWAGLVKPRGAFADNASGKPWLRRVAMRLPRSMWPVPPAYGHVFAFLESGTVALDLQDPSGDYPEATAVTETDDRLYVQSLHAKTLGWLEKKPLGL